MLELCKLSKSYSTIPAVSQVSFCARPSEVTGYLGANGSGKSTTMKMIAGLIQRDAGEILFNGRLIEHDLKPTSDPSGMSPRSPIYIHTSAAGNISS